MKKIIALVLALAMVALVGLASAATITIQAADAAEGSGTAEYTVYKLFDVTKATNDSDEVTGYAYTITSGTLKTALDGVKKGADNTGDAAFTFTESSANPGTYVVTANWQSSDETTSKNVAANIKAALETANIAATATYDEAGAKSVDDGYYLVTSSLGTNLGLATTDIPFTVVEKNNPPSVDKEDTEVTVEIGQTNEYHVTVNVPATVAPNKTITVVDTMSDGLTGVKGTDGKLAVSSSPSVGLTVGATTNGVTEIVIAAEAVWANKGGSIVLTYSATVNENAVVNEPETNSAHIIYDNFTSVETPETEVKTLGFKLEKTDGTGGKLAGVTFTLQNAANEYYTEPSDSSSIDEDRFVATEATITTDANGEYDFVGLEAGVYTLTEKETLTGYNLLTAPISITVAEDNTISYTIGETTSTGVVKITVVNNQGTELPSTGGIGTTIFYILGGLLVVGAVVILVARRKAQD